MKIAMIAPIWTTVPPKKYGGTELVVYNLVEGLIKRGHKVTLFASGNSKTSGKLVYVWEKDLLSDKIAGAPIPWHNQLPTLLHIAYAFKYIKNSNFDIIHAHSDENGLPNLFIDLIDTPTVITIHNEFPKSYREDRYKIFKVFKKHNFISLSYAQRKTTRLKLHFVGNVYNGIEVEMFEFDEKPKEYLFWIGRFTKIKGAHIAIRLAKKLKLPLILAGRNDLITPSNKTYWEKEIKPSIDGKLIKYVGEVTFKQKVKLYKNAKVVLVPILWEEPFGLVMIEAMACGTPVIAFKRGAAPEIIKNGITGFIVENEREMKESIKKIDKISRKECRKLVEKKFTVDKMVENYERIYKKIIKK